jgi:hypothetical protein
MSETRITREEIKGVARSRNNDDADAADINESADKCCGCGCEDGACEWHDD